MKWYYVENGSQAGPVEETELGELVQSGRLTGDTYTWHEGMANWEPFSAVCPPEFAAWLAVAAPARAGMTATATEAACAECGGVFPKEEMIPHGKVFVCASCKPVFIQKLAEGANISTGELNYASIGLRFGALVLDGVLLWIVSFAFQLLSVSVVAGGMNSQAGTAVVVQFGLMFLQMMVAVLYETLMIGRYGATLGKMVCKIKVVTADGGRVSYLRALGRYFAKVLSGMMCLIGYIMALFDKQEKRALHDHICNTRVVYK